MFFPEFSKLNLNDGLQRGFSEPHPPDWGGAAANFAQSSRGQLGYCRNRIDLILHHELRLHSQSKMFLLSATNAVPPGCFQAPPNHICTEGAQNSHLKGLLWVPTALQVKARRPATSTMKAYFALQSFSDPAAILANAGGARGNSTGFSPRICRIFPSGKIPENEEKLRCVQGKFR